MDSKVNREKTVSKACKVLLALQVLRELLDPASKDHPVHQDLTASQAFQDLEDRQDYVERLVLVVFKVALASPERLEELVQLGCLEVQESLVNVV